jgi:HPt (histidine-containing phosphotransfer) domain-containing protein
MPETLAASPAVFDRGEALTRACGNGALLRELVALFLEDAPRWLWAIRSALHSREQDRLWRTAHTLLGSAASLSARATQEAARGLETLARAGDLAGAAEALPALESALDRLLPVLGEVAEDGPAGADGSVPPNQPTPLPWRRSLLQEVPS